MDKRRLGRFRQRSQSDGYVENEIVDVVTSPVDMLSRELTETQRELASNLGVDLDSPVSFGDFVKLLDRVNDVKRSAGPSDEIRSMRVKVNVMWALLLAALIAAGGSLVTVARSLKDSGKEELQRQQLIEHDSDHERRLRRLEWRGLDMPSPAGVGSQSR